jgi:hypothetical protein
MLIRVPHQGVESVDKVFLQIRWLELLTMPDLVVMRPPFTRHPPPIEEPILKEVDVPHHVVVLVR